MIASGGGPEGGRGAVRSTYPGLGTTGVSARGRLAAGSRVHSRDRAAIVIRPTTGASVADLASVEFTE